jgi:hypothetical protein
MAARTRELATVLCPEEAAGFRPRVHTREIAKLGSLASIGLR